MNRGPGRYRCVTYLKAWTHGSRDWADPHVLNCDFCRPIAYGDGKRFIGTIHEEAARLRARRRRATHTRRAFLAAGAASVLALATGVIWMNGEETRARTGNGTPVAPKTMSRLKKLDEAFKVDGFKGIEKRLKQGSEADCELILFWIGERREPSLYPLIAASLTDQRAAIRMAAVAEISLFDRADALPLLPDIQAAAAVETDPEVKASLDVLQKLIQ
jgi:hypothetical protein